MRTTLPAARDLQRSDTGSVVWYSDELAVYRGVRANGQCDQETALAAEYHRAI